MSRAPITCRIAHMLKTTNSETLTTVESLVMPNDVLLDKNVNQGHMLRILNNKIDLLNKEKEDIQAQLNLKNDMLISRGYAQDAVMKKEYTKGRVVSRMMHIESTTDESLEDMKAMKMRMDAIEPRMGAVEARMGALEARFGALDVKIDTVDVKLDAIMTLLQSLTRVAQ